MTITDPTPVDAIRVDVQYLDDCIRDLNGQAADREFTEDEQARFDAGLVERARLVALIERHNEVARLGNIPASVVSGDGPTGAPNVNLNRDADPFDLSEIRWNAPATAVRSKALSAIEKVAGLSDAERTRAEEVFGQAETEDGVLARHLLVTGSDAYRTGWQKMAGGLGAFLEPAERNALLAARSASLTTTAGGFAVPFTLDPAIIDTGVHTFNPFRQISRVVSTTTNVWHGVSSAGVTASWDGEGAEVSDDAPTLAQPSVTCYKGQAFVPFSVEIGGDWAAIESDLRMMLQQARDDLEGAAFAVGSGSGAPKGIVTALAAVSGSKVAPATAETFAIADVYAVESALAPRYRSRARWVANKTWYSRIRQFDTAGGAGMWERIGAAQPANLLGYPAQESSDMDSVLPDAAATANNYAMVLGDFSNYVIADRIGLSIELVPHLFDTANNLPNGKRGFLAWFRTGADAVNADAFRMLSIPTAA